MKERENIVEILKRRDEMTFEEASSFIDEVLDEVMMAVENGSFQEAEDVFTSMTGLESDYLMDLLI